MLTLFASAYTLALLADLVQPNLAQDGGAGAGQVPSLTSTNNFMCGLHLAMHQRTNYGLNSFPLVPGSNFCDTVQLPLTDGQQIVGGSCNPTPMCATVSGGRGYIGR